MKQGLWVGLFSCGISHPSQEQLPCNKEEAMSNTRWKKRLWQSIVLGFLLSCTLGVMLGCSGPVPCNGGCADGFTCQENQCVLDCGTDKTKCDDQCVETKTNTSHCGACGNACQEGQTCEKGACQTTCEAKETLCSDACVDTQTSLEHCGACNNKCATNEECTTGKCTTKSLCSTEQTECNGQCVNTNTDDKHCGSCGNACSSDKVCDQGSCQCKTDKTACDDGNGSTLCVDTAINPKHCGACNTSCKDTEECKAGSCELVCGKGQIACGKICITTDSDNNHCGACDNKCEGDLTCVQGSCACPADRIRCGTTCVDGQSDPKNCGQCSYSCSAKEVCTSGKCKTTCKTGEVECSGACVDTQTSTQHCGVCGTACAKGQICCGGGCVDASTNNLHCGTCNKACTTGNACCGGGCVDLQSDINNCGNCGVLCVAGRTCEKGQCTCDGMICNGTCVNTKTNTKHCGKCGTTCASTQICHEGTCKKPCPTGKVYCGNTCVDLQTNPDHCGKCGTVCTTTQACVAGACNNSCSTGLMRCSRQCIDLSTSSQHCGGCGKACSNGKVCQSSACKCLSNKEICDNNKDDDCNGKIDDGCELAVSGGGPKFDYGQGIAADSSGNIYVTGQFQGSTAFGTYTLTATNTSNQIFLLKLDKDGNVAWLVSAGGTSNDTGYAVDTDSSGNVYFSGTFQGTGTFGSTKLSGGSSTFVAKLDKNGKWQWAKSINTGAKSKLKVINGSVYITSSFNKTVNALGRSFTSNGQSAFVAKISSKGVLQWLKSSSHTGSSAYGGDIAVDKNENLYITGKLDGDAGKTATFGTTKLTTQGRGDIFVAKLDKNGAWKWARSVGGTSLEQGIAISVHPSASTPLAAIVGTFVSSSLGFGSTTISKTKSYNNLFVALIDSNGNWKWTKAYGNKTGSKGSTRGTAIGIDSAGNTYTGVDHFGTLDLSGSLTLTGKGDSDAIVLKHDNTGKLLWYKHWGTTGAEKVNSIYVDAANRPYFTGFFGPFNSTTSKTITISAQTLTSQGFADIFIARSNR